MASEENAVSMVNYCSTAIPHIHNQPVYVQYSNHRELKTDSLPSQAVSMIFSFSKIELYMTYISK